MTKIKTKIGRIYKKYRKLADGTRIDQSTWTVRYKGDDYATGETDKKKAEQFLLRKAGELATKQQIHAADPTASVLMNKVLDLAVSDGKRKGNKGSLADEQQIDLHLRPFFGDMLANRLATADYDAYIASKLDDDYAPATINRQLAKLKHALKLARDVEPYLITRFPKINMFGSKALKTRQGFLTYPEYVALRNTLPDYLVPIFVAGYHVGCRRGELLQVEMRDIEMDAEQPQFRVWPDAAKNGDGRIIPVYGEMLDAFRRQIAANRRDFPRCPFLFHNEGAEILTFYKAWDTARTAAGLPTLLFHDLRRTAVRNLIRSGVDKKVAREITGHKTDSVFDRYDITNEADLVIAATKMSVWINAQYEKLPKAA